MMLFLCSAPLREEKKGAMRERSCALAANSTDSYMNCRWLLITRDLQFLPCFGIIPAQVFSHFITEYLEATTIAYEN
jgi:hypothetical protein